MKKRYFRLLQLFILLFCMSLGFMAKSQTAKADLMLDGRQIDGSCAIFFDGQPLREIQYNGTVVWRAGADITYSIDSGIDEIHFVPYGQTTLSVTGSKEEYEFVGWREDTTASGDVLESDLCTGDAKTLYAVFQKAVTVTYYNGSSTPQTSAQYIYYNNGNISYPEFTIAQASLDGWTGRGWTTEKAADAKATYHELDCTVLEADMTLYGVYQKTITASFNGNGAGGGSTASLTGTAYYNSAGNTTNPTFKLPGNGFTKNGYVWTGWAQGSTGGTQYGAGASVTLSGNTTFYAGWKVLRAAYTAVSDAHSSLGYRLYCDSQDNSDWGDRTSDTYFRASRDDNEECWSFDGHTDWFPVDGLNYAFVKVSSGGLADFRIETDRGIVYTYPNAAPSGWTVTDGQVTALLNGASKLRVWVGCSQVPYASGDYVAVNEIRFY